MTTLHSRAKAALGQCGLHVSRLLGSGGTAQVFLAESTRYDVPVAVKVLRPELASVVGWERFHREIRIARELSHPNIVPILESGRSDGLPFAVFPFFEEGSLRHLLHGVPFSPERAITTVAQVGEALEHAHSHGIIHRDVKPENILLQGEQALLADLGLAKAIETAAGDALTATGVVIGTPAYMSPEQATGARDVDHRTDIYSLGCVFFELLAAERLFSGTRPEDLAAGRFDDRKIKALSGIGDGLRWTLSRMVAIKSEDRFSSLAEVLDILKADG